MEVEELLSLAKRLSQTDFATRFPHLFLVFREAESGITPFSFHTEVATPSSPPPSLRGSLRVKPLVKSSGNPYTERVSIGRARNCDIILRDSSVSKLHAQVRQGEDGKFELIDLGSQNGTSVNDVKTKPNEAVPLHADDLITVGTVGVRVLSAKVVHTILSKM